MCKCKQEDCQLAVVATIGVPKLPAEIKAKMCHSATIDIIDIR
jgi:hypothetical protein